MAFVLVRKEGSIMSETSVRGESTRGEVDVPRWDTHLSS